ncbi:DUF3325 family protein [Azospirillum thermophilum]|uniref:DUF3325 domain-containing protein n=1 Tax=Azospirillum thermophilum TaxID=2202148 RepID=A0A2S2CWD7_9PROT|nr:DUF3325 family protein [Azospirillum thermophilum]AWK88789.1 hypothetical protein DEW08_22190 [Azospirillum thermophilum]
MHDALTLLVVFALVYLGFAALAQVLDRRRRDLLDARGGPLHRTAMRLRLSGLVCATVALGVAVLRDGMSFGFLLWTLALTVGALAVGATLARMSAGRRTPHP